MASVRRPEPRTLAEAFEGRAPDRAVPSAVRLLKAGARGDDVALQDAMVQLAASGNLHGIERLIDAGASANAIDEHGWSALATAVDHTHSEIVEALLRAGADPSSGDPPPLAVTIGRGDWGMLRRLRWAGARGPLWIDRVARLVEAHSDAPKLEITSDVASCLSGEIDPVVLHMGLRRLDGIADAVGALRRLRALIVQAGALSLSTLLPHTFREHPTLEVLVLFGGAYGTYPSASLLSSMPNLVAVHVGGQPAIALDCPGVEITFRDRGHERVVPR